MVVIRVCKIFRKMERSSAVTGRSFPGAVIGLGEEDCMGEEARCFHSKELEGRHYKITAVCICVFYN